MLVLLFDIMEFGIVGGYLSKLCVTLPHMSIHTRIVTFSGLFFTDFLQISRILPYKIIYYFSASGQLPNVHNMLHNKAYDRDATPAGSSYQDRFPACFDELDHITV